MRQLDGDTGVHITEIFIRKRRGIIFNVVEHIKPISGFLMRQAHAHLVGLHQDFQLGVFFDIGAAHFRPTRNRNLKIV